MGTPLCLLCSYLDEALTVLCGSVPNRGLGVEPVLHGGCATHLSSHRKRSGTHRTVSTSVLPANGRELAENNTVNRQSSSCGLMSRL